jgi:hypothetical protein
VNAKKLYDLILKKKIKKIMFQVEDLTSNNFCKKTKDLILKKQNKNNVSG